MDQERIKRMASLSGSDKQERMPKYDVPIIKFGGDVGAFKLIRTNEDGTKSETPIESPVDFIILKKRRIISAISGDGDYFSNEHNSVNDKIIVYKKFANTISKYAIGYAPALKEKNKDLKTVEVMYVLYDNEVCKFQVKGSGLSPYYDFQKSLSKESLHSFQVMTSVGFESAVNEKGKKFFKVNFKHSPLPEDDELYDLIEKKTQEVTTFTMRNDEYFFKKIAQEEGRTGEMNAVGALTKDHNAALANSGNGKTSPTVEGDEINIEDIPF